MNYDEMVSDFVKSVLIVYLQHSMHTHRDGLSEINRLIEKVNIVQCHISKLTKMLDEDLVENKNRKYIDLFVHTHKRVSCEIQDLKESLGFLSDQLKKSDSIAKKTHGKILTQVL